MSSKLNIASALALVYSMVILADAQMADDSHKEIFAFGPLRTSSVGSAQHTNKPPEANFTRRIRRYDRQVSYLSSSSACATSTSAGYGSSSSACASTSCGSSSSACASSSAGYASSSSACATANSGYGSSSSACASSGSGSSSSSAAASSSAAGGYGLSSLLGSSLRASSRPRTRRPAACCADKGVPEII